jgi:hypothetical protein
VHEDRDPLIKKEAKKPPIFGGFFFVIFIGLEPVISSRGTVRAAIPASLHIIKGSTMKAYKLESGGLITHSSSWFRR